MAKMQKGNHPSVQIKQLYYQKIKAENNTHMRARAHTLLIFLKTAGLVHSVLLPAPSLEVGPGFWDLDSSTTPKSTEPSTALCWDCHKGLANLHPLTERRSRGCRDRPAGCGLGIRCPGCPGFRSSARVLPSCVSLGLSAPRFSAEGAAHGEGCPDFSKQSAQSPAGSA